MEGLKARVGRRVRAARLTAVMGTAVVFAATAAAGASSAAADDPGVARFARIDASLLESSGPAGTWLPASMSNRQATVMLQFSGEPVAVAEAAERKQGAKLTPQQKASIRADLKARQDAAKGDLQKAGASVVGQLQDAYNGVLVTVPLQNVGELASLPGVTAVHSVPLYRPANVNGVPFVDGPQAWGGFDRTGRGVKVASIDSGVDYTHANFGGPGTVAAYDAARASGTQVPDPTLVGARAPKVKGGYDFVGDAYDAEASDPALRIPHPDPNPLDCNEGDAGGHGSHTAGTLAGFGVLDGKTYAGPYDATTVAAHAGHWTIGPGIAPDAELYSYRVFGCSGPSSVIALGIDQAVKDGVDVISMSLGSPFGGQGDPTSVAAQNAIDAGITVVASAGNDGQNAYLVGSPSTTAGVVSVAAEDGSVATYPGAHIALDTGKALDALNADDVSFADNTSLPIAVVRDSSGGVSFGCSVTDFQAAGVQGKLAVVRRGVCARAAKAIYGQQGGAAAVAMINNAPGLPPFEGKITSNPDTGEAADVTIPFFGVDLGSAADLTAATRATLTNVVVPNADFQKVASFSSGGPRSSDSAFKPEVSAPGVSIVSTGVGTGNGPATETGTSMAAPLTAGIAALVKEAHPDWKPDEVKAAIMNTADSTKVRSSARVAGNGTVQADRALAATGLATTADHLDSLSFGHVPATGAFNVEKTFTITNTGASTVSYSLAASAPVTVSPGSVTLAPGKSADVTATISLTAAQVAGLPSVDNVFSPPGRVATITGAVTATPNDGSPVLRVPYLLAPRALSDVKAGAVARYGARGTSNVFDTSVTAANTGVHAGAADFYAWGIHDAKDTPLAEMDIRDVGVQSFPDGTIVFAINDYGRVANAAQNEYDVAIDLQHNGKPDFYVVGADEGAVLTGSFDGRMGSFLVDAKTGAVVDASFLADAPMSGSTVLLPVSASKLGLHAADADFVYGVTGYSIVPGGIADATGVATYDAANPGLSSGAYAALAPGKSATVPLWADKDKLRSAPALGWLAVSLDDASGAAQADEIPLGTLR